MLVIRADPWLPDYGAGFDVAADEVPVRSDPAIETSDWSRGLAPAGVARGPVWFVDGVRRVDLRLIAEEGPHRAPGLFGSFAVGCVRSDGRATFEESSVRRAVVLAGGLSPERVDIASGGLTLTFDPDSQPGSDPDRPLWGLQQLMRRAEAAAAARVAGHEGEVVIVDGPLTFSDPTRSAVVGVVKRFARMYLEPEQDELVGRLRPGERTPLFGIGDESRPTDRFAWYARLVPLRPHWHDHAGVVRCEVREGIGLGAAVELADRVTAMLPGFAGRPTDPRAPQNLAPVGALESRLRHRMGNPAFVRRALIEWLAAAN